jgi:hypothetical protein
VNARGMHGMWPGAHPAVKGLRIAGLVVMGVIGAALFALVFGWLVMVLWNWLMPAVFHLGEITYWQAFGIMVLAKLLFGGIGAGRHGGPGHRRWKGGDGPHGPGRGRDEWHWYREFWETEGKEAFDRFAQKKSAGSSGPAGGGSEAPLA